MHSMEKRLLSTNVLDFVKYEIPPPSIKYEYSFEFDLKIKYPNCKIEVIKEDTLNATKILQENGFNPLTLNMACQWGPGGGWLKGSGAQEESLFYRSVYYQTLDPCLYPIKLGEAIYSPNVTIFRDDQLDELEKEKCWKANFVAAAAISYPYILQIDKVKVKDIELTYKKMNLIFEIAIHHNHDSLVLSAFGCGAYNNNTKVIIKIFNFLISKYRKFFRRIVFAIISKEDANLRYRNGRDMQDNYSIFKRYIKVDY